MYIYSSLYTYIDPPVPCPRPGDGRIAEGRRAALYRSVGVAECC